MLKLPLSPAFMKKSLKALAYSAAGIAVTGFFLIPAVVRPLLERKLAELIHRTVVVRGMYLNPFTLAVALKGVTISQRDSPEVMLSFDEFSVNLQSASLFKGGLIIGGVRLVKPQVNAARNKDLTYNFSDLIPSGAGQPKDNKPPKEPLKFSINNIEVKNGSADFYDAPRNTRHTLRDVNISVPFLSNLPYYVSSYVEPSLEATVNNTAIAFKGKSRPFDESLETTVVVDLKDVDLPYYLAYSPIPLNFRLVSGKLDVQAAVSFQQFKDRPPTVSINGTVGFKNIRLAGRNKKPLVELTLFQVSLLPSDLMTKTVHLSEISIIAPKIYVERDPAGELDIVKAFAPANRAPEEKPETALRENTPRTSAPLPVVDIDVLSIRDGMALFTDRQPVSAPGGGEDAGQEPVKIRVDNIALKGDSLSTREKIKGSLELSLNINTKGFLRSSGTLGLNPLDFETHINIGEIAFRAFQPYVAQKADVLLDDGRLFMKGAAIVRSTGARGLSGSYRGSASLHRLMVRNSRNSDELLSWKLLQFGGIDARFNPLLVKIKTIALTDFYAGIVAEDDGALNLQKIVKKAPGVNGQAGEEKTQEPAAPGAGQAPAASGNPPDIAIEQVTLARGNINFTDRHVKPMYTANLAELNGKVTGLSSKEDRMADVHIAALFDQYAPLAIDGRINPLRNELFVDVKTDFKDLELSTLTPYSGAYIGRAIEKGKLSFGLQYHIVKKKLDAKNDIFIDQLTLGEAIDSPKATKLPVGLAISLLKNRKGEIKLDIPVTGEIDDPQFSVWRIVLQVLKNLLVKAATSPFALLGSMLGGGEELGYAEFDYGASAVTEENAKKLDTLVNALYDRPALKLEITGYVDPEKDGEALRTRRMKSLIASQKIKGLPRRDDQAVSPESVQVSANEYPVYLKKAYKSGKFSKPRNLFGIARDLPDGEMEKLLLASIEVTDGDLRQLGSVRARTIKEMILKTQKVEPERIFLLEPKSLAPEQKDKIKNSRVNFSLR